MAADSLESSVESITIFTASPWISTGNFHDDGFNISYEALIDVCNFGCKQAFLLIFINLVMSCERESLSIGELLHRRSADYPLREKPTWHNRFCQ